MIELEGNITLAGFKELGYGDFTIVKKVVGDYAKKISDKQPFTNLTLTLKPVHKTTDEVRKFELKSRIEVDGQLYTSELVDHNLFVAIDTIMKKLIAQLGINN